MKMPVNTIIAAYLNSTLRKVGAWFQKQKYRKQPFLSMVDLSSLRRLACLGETCNEAVVMGEGTTFRASEVPF